MTSPRWAGQCPDCGAWNTLVEQRPIAAVTGGVKRARNYAGELKTSPLANVKAEETARRAVGLGEFDRVLGGGLVPGSVVLIGGDPGIGKSTLLLQVAAAVSAQSPVLYVTGEESLAQVGLRARRLGVADSAVTLAAETRIEAVLALIEREKPAVLIVDSIQTIYTDALSSAPGSVAQLRESTALLVRIAKQAGIAVFLVGHVTKQGAIAGPRVLEHMVDTVLYFENDAGSRYRAIRAVKNRFGAANELGVFAMTEGGLKEVRNPSAIFLAREGPPSAGSVVTVLREGTRPLLIEVQALVDESQLSNPRRVAVGTDVNRLGMLLAVCTAMPGAPFTATTYSSTWSAASRSTKPVPTLPLLPRLHRASPTNPCRPTLSSSAKSDSAARCAPFTAARNASPKPRPKASSAPSSPPPMRCVAKPSRVSTSSPSRILPRPLTLWIIARRQ